MNYTEPDHYYSSCDYEMIGSCHDCLTEHPGNWFVLLDDGVSSCCVPSPTDVKFPRYMDINSTAECPRHVLVASAPYLLGGYALTFGVVALGMFGKWVYDKFLKKCAVEPEVVTDIEMRDLAGADVHGQLEPNDAEMLEVPPGIEHEDEWESVDLGYVGDGEGTSPPVSEDERLNVLCLNETDEDYESDGGERLFMINM